MAPLAASTELCRLTAAHAARAQGTISHKPKQTHALLEVGRGQDYLQQVADCARQAEASCSTQLAYVPTMLQAGAAFLEGDLARAEQLARYAGI